MPACRRKSACPASPAPRPPAPSRPNSTSLLQDHEGFQVVVQKAYQSGEQAVHDQIARLTSDGDSQPQPQEIVEVRTSPAITGTSVNRIPAAQFTSQPSPRPATASQVRAIRAICTRRKIDLLNLLREMTPARFLYQGS